MSVEVKELVKIYGEQKAVDAISFTANTGEILGFLGPNGAGKSTTMKIATSYLPPNKGQVKVEGVDVHEEPIKAKSLIGYLPEHNPLYLDMYVHEYLYFIASLHGIKGKLAKESIQKMISLTGLGLEQRKKVGALSKGYRQRVGLAQALIHDPKVLILDEPTTGLDPNQIVEIRNMIKELSKERTVILSTHIMQEVQAICDRVVIINHGKIVANDTVENLSGTADQKIVKAEFKSAVDELKLQQVNGVFKLEKISGSVYHIHFKGVEDPRDAIFQIASENNWTLLELSLKVQSLEEVFQNLTKKNVNQG